MFSILVPVPVLDLTAISLSPTTVTISWNGSVSILFRPVWFTITYHSISCYIQSNSKQVNEATEETSVNLEPGQVYNISLTATNPIGDSEVVTISYTTPSQSLLKVTHNYNMHLNCSSL